MNFAKFKTALTSYNFKRLLKPKVLEHLVIVIKLLCIIFTLAIVALGAKAVTSTQDRFTIKIDDLTKKIDSYNVKQTSLPKADIEIDSKSVNLTKVFGPIGQANQSTNQKPTETSLPLSLIGVFLPDDEEAYAIIQDDKKNLQEVFGPNESIFGAAKLLNILNDRVEIERNGVKEILVMDLSAPTKGDSGSTSQVSENEFTVDESELDKALENLPLLLTQARAVPYFKDGKAIGLRLFAIRGGSLFEKIGLQNGDVLKSVNGNSLADLSQAMQLFQKLKDERAIDLALERNMAEKQFKYSIK